MPGCIFVTTPPPKGARLAEDKRDEEEEDAEDIRLLTLGQRIHEGCGGELFEGTCQKCGKRCPRCMGAKVLYQPGDATVENPGRSVPCTSCMPPAAGTTDDPAPEDPT